MATEGSAAGARRVRLHCIYSQEKDECWSLVLPSVVFSGSETGQVTLYLQPGDR